MVRVAQHADSSDHDNRRSANDSPPDTDSVLARWVEQGRRAIRARPITAVGSAAAVGFMAGSLTPRLIAQPLAALILRSLLIRVLGDGD